MTTVLLGQRPTFRHSRGLPLETRFWERVRKTERCWVWIASRAGRGYGFISVMQGRRQKWHYAHRLSYEWAYGPIPEGLFVCHHCDNPPCVRPDHLFLGTASDNQRDAQHKGRRPIRSPRRPPKPRETWNIQRGEAHRWATKLTEKSVRDIRAEYAAGLGSMQDLSRVYGVDIGHIQRIIRRKVWKHVA